MLSKEEIEKAKEELEEISIETELDFVYKNIEIILEYIEQLEQEKADRTHAENYEKSYISKLESDKQKLIEKLEKDIREETGYARWTNSYTKEISPAVTRMISKSKYAQEILSILKGESQVTVK